MTSLYELPELVAQLRHEADRNALMQGDKAHQTNRRRKTFRYRNHLFSAAADKLELMEAALAVVWTRITEDESSWPENGRVLVAQWYDGWQVANISTAQLKIGDWWRPLSPLDKPPPEQDK